MKKILNFIKNKILMFIFALILPLSATGVALSFANQDSAKADSDSTTYYNSYTSEVSLTNSNFNSSSSNYSISTSLSGWTGQNNDKKTTGGIINVGTSFQTYMTSTYHLSKNPGSARTTDKKILMINSQISGSGNYDTARQGYKSSDVTLASNSFYSFQVAFKSDTNYLSNTVYDSTGETVNETGKSISKSVFEATPFAETIGDNVYLSFTYRSATYYVAKSLTALGTLADDIENLTTDTVFYEDDNFIGIKESTGDAFYVKRADYVDNKLLAGTQTYQCALKWDGSKYAIEVGTEYFKARTDYTSLGDHTFGSMYLSGLKDSDGNNVDAQFVEVSSRGWVTYYFFVATGDQEQTVNLELWLGSKEFGHNSSGVVFFDDCHVYQYSANAFWNMYKKYADANYTQEVTSGGVTTTQTYDCSTLVDLSINDNLDTSAFNFDFENGEYNTDAQPVKLWTKTGSGNARVFNVGASSFFKSTTGYDFVGSDMSCKVDLSGDITLTKNQYVLGLWTNKNSVKVTSNDIAVDANTVYKVTAYYKVAGISDGNAYMFVSENDNVLLSYDLDEDDYTLASEASSSALSATGSNSFINNYSTVEFYIKGNALYNSSANISFGLGNGSETATGCIVIDDITITRASSSDYENATNKIVLGGSLEAGSASVPNGNFNVVSFEKDATYPLSATSWTAESGSGLTFAGVINTLQSEYDRYVALYNENKDAGVESTKNPYYWASYSTTSPKNANNRNDVSDNVYMLANITSSWQTLQSSMLSLAANSTSKLAFAFKTGESINVKLFDSNGILLFESGNITSAGLWKTYEIYVKSFSGASQIYAVVEFGNKTTTTTGFAYLDNFVFSTVDSAVFEEKSATAEGNSDLFGVADLSNFYLNVTNTDLTSGTNGAYSGVSTGSSNHGEITTGEELKTNSIYALDDETAKAFYFNNQVVGSYAITSNYGIDLSEGYYTLSFKVKTYFAVAEEDLDSDTTYSYGVTVGLTGYDYMKNIRSDDGYETYTIYLHPTESKTANLYISFVSDKNETRGSAVVYDIALTESDSDAYSTANSTFTSKSYDLNTDRIMIAKASGASEDEEESTDDETDEESTPASNNALNWSLIISGVITGLAIILAVVFTIMKNIKVKKIEVKRKESYDRKSSLELNAIKKRAEAQQKAEIKELQESVDKLQAEIDRLEKEHKQTVVQLRQHDQGKVSKTTDKEFKSFAKKRTVIAEKIANLNGQIENIKSPEYLLTLERRIYAKDEMEKRELKKQSKLAEKKGK
ncbi:MAG: hypothetical protein IJ817_00645 [Clostridia bacterium]|nr:hypothetical protein [Clostridia bacterium]